RSRTASCSAIAEMAGFDVMLTCDQNIAYQQNLTGRQIAIVVLGTNDWSVLRHAGALIAEAVAAATPNSFQTINVRAIDPSPA
nr:hypothetical protein [Acidobacteriota bacterium]